jgi:hypothetical protein
MTTAELVNLILDKLRTGRVTFIAITELEYDDPCGCMRIEYGGNSYDICHDPEADSVLVTHDFITDNYSRHLEGILNGHVRNEEGELVIDNHDA